MPVDRTRLTWYHDSGEHVKPTSTSHTYLYGNNKYGDGLTSYYSSMFQYINIPNNNYNTSRTNTRIQAGTYDYQLTANSGKQLIIVYMLKGMWTSNPEYNRFWVTINGTLYNLDEAYDAGLISKVLVWSRSSSTSYSYPDINNILNNTNTVSKSFATIRIVFETDYSIDSVRIRAGTTSNWTSSYNTDGLYVYTIPSNDYYLENYEMTESIFNITFETNGAIGNIPESQTLNLNEYVIQPTNPIKDGYSFAGWYDETLTTEYGFNTPVTNDLTLYAKWIPLYTISFESNEAITNIPEDQIVLENEYITEPAIPIKDGYLFVGWYDETLTTEYNFNVPVISDLILYAKWIPLYTVSFDTNEAIANIPEDQILLGNEYVTEPIVPIKTGYIFKGWFLDNEYKSIFDFDNEVTQDISLYAKWDKLYLAKKKSPTTTLTNPITAVQTTIEVEDGSKLPDAPNIATIGMDGATETISYENKNGNILSGVTRGMVNTPSAWNSGTEIARYFTFYDYDTFKKGLEDLQKLVIDLLNK